MSYSNYSNHPRSSTTWVGVSNAGRKYEAVSCALYGVALVTVILRIIARLQQFRRLFLDDLFCIIAQIFAFGMIAIAVIFTEKFGMGWHLDTMPPEQVEKFFQLFYSAEICYTMVAVSYKLAVIFLYQRIFNEVKPFKIASWVMVAASIGWSLGQMLSATFQCTPIPKAWNATLPGHCINIQSFILGSGIANLLIDTIILSMPFPMVWRLHLDWKRKLTLTAMFMLGSVVCIASILRITTIIPLDKTDGTYSLFGIALWSNIELAIGIIASCLPTLRQYFFSSTAAHSAVSSKWLSWARGKSGLNSIARSDTGVALADWKINAPYGEIKAYNSVSETPSKQDFLHKNRSDIESQDSPKVVFD